MTDSPQQTPIDTVNHAAPSRGFVEAVKICLQKFVTFKGRASRSEFWWFALFLVLVSSLAATLNHIATTAAWHEALAVAERLFALATFLPMWSVSVRRLHDLNLSGWFYFPYTVVWAMGDITQVVYIIWVANLMVIGLLPLFCFAGKSAPNKYDAVTFVNGQVEKSTLRELLSMEKIRSVAAVVAGAAIFVGGIALSLFWVVGEIYWLWVAIQIKSFSMFVVGIIPPALPITASVGAYSLIFGTPNWVLALFGP